MEGIDVRAFKPSLRGEISMKSTQQVFFEDVLCLNGANVVSGDDFSVDDLLDLSNEKFGDGFVEDEEEEEEEEKDSLSVSSQDRAEDDNSNSSSFSGASDEFEAFPAVPVEDWKDLEWVSQFVDDSVSEFSLLCPAGTGKEIISGRVENRSEPELKPAIRRLACFPSTVPVKPRSKRSRATGRTWALASPPLTESSLTSSLSSPSSTLCLILTKSPQNMDFFCSLGKPPTKKQKRKLVPAQCSGGTQSQQRRCSHCQVQKTPQWRTGPLGAKTLCNACGVRYKSGRLFPEYRPACSPTFSGDVHSNSHRKVLEMRRKKEMAGPEPGLTPIVSSC
ncbi:GATA transcription factor 5-like [Malania oleifera]|uniref:GATA transcription factor 5-like n=1 Tax=Malania oleifera TaxID=397392 RepID=UPI0025AD9E17|nr:GATA transcription factor 5-like [Malania oleifera]